MNAPLKHSLVIAGLMLASTTAFAETFTAKINFPFRAGSTAYPAADYEIQVSSAGGAPLVKIRNVDSNTSSMMTSLPTDHYVQPGESKLLFQCHQETGCALSQVRSPYGSAWNFPMRKATPAELENVAIVGVPMRLAKAGK